MLHLIFCLRRLPQLSRQEFQRYWREHHAPLVVRAHAAALGIHRYVQAHTVDHPVAEAAVAGGAPQAFDGVAELWFDTEELYACCRPTAALPPHKRCSKTNGASSI